MKYKYDLFISFKNSVQGVLTEDGEVAKAFYEHLKKSGYNVFFSNSTLYEEGVANYMIEIQQALEKSKALLLVYSQDEYITEGWVAQEWMSFLNLLLSDSNRDIFIYSINNRAESLPPFLKPYECFIDFKKALNHLKNSLNKEYKRDTNKIQKKDFLNAYWNLFGNTDITLFLNKSISDLFKNYPVYSSVIEYILNRDIAQFVAEIISYIKRDKSTLASYYLNLYLRSQKHLNLEYAKYLMKTAYSLFTSAYSSNVENSTIDLIIMTDKDEYDGAFYMAEIISDVLSAYNIEFNIDIVDPKVLSTYKIDSNKTSIFFWSSTLLDVPEDFISELRKNRENIYIGLNSFGKDALPYNLDNLKIFDNNEADITKILRKLLS